jgi:hypothetical protein
MSDLENRDLHPRGGNNDIETAYHEAGHAVIGCLYGRFPTSITIEREGHAAGKTDFEPAVLDFVLSHLSPSPRQSAYAEVRVVGELAGSAAHDLFKSRRTLDQGDKHDLHWAKQLIDELAGSESPDTYLAFARAKATQLLQENWQWVEAVAPALLTRGTVSRAEILDLKPDREK